MDIGKKIAYARKLRGMYQEELAERIGLGAGNVGRTRISQYETGSRTPKRKMIEDIARVLDVSIDYLDTPSIEYPIGLLHTLFEMEDLYDLKLERKQKGFSLNLGEKNDSVHAVLQQWLEMKEQLQCGVISKKEYDDWRYQLSKINLTQNEDNAPKGYCEFRKVDPKEELFSCSPCAGCQLKETYKEIVQLAPAIHSWLQYDEEHYEGMKEILSCHIVANGTKSRMSVENGIIMILTGQALCSRVVNEVKNGDVVAYKTEYEEWMKGLHGYPWLRNCVETIQPGEWACEGKKELLKRMDELYHTYVAGNTRNLRKANSEIYKLNTISPKKKTQ